MVRLTYDPTPLDLKKELTVLLRHIWNCNTHGDRHDYVDCSFYEEWCICNDYDLLDLKRTVPGFFRENVVIRQKL